MGRVSRGTDVSWLGISNQDLDSRVGVVMGWLGGEVLPPFNKKKLYWLSTEERKARAKKAREIRNYVESIPFHKCPIDFDYNDYIKSFWQTKIVEVAGGMSNCCIVGAVEDIVDNGSVVLVNPTRTLAPQPLMPLYWVGRIMIRELLHYRKDMACHVKGEDFLFYRR